MNPDRLSMERDGDMNQLGHATLNRLQILLEDAKFQWNEESAHSPKLFMAIGKHNLEQYKKIQALPFEKRERIQNLISNLLANPIQEAAISNYGVVDAESVNEVVSAWFNQPEDQSYVDSIRRTAAVCLQGLDFDEDQVQVILNNTIEAFPELLAEAIEKLVSNSYLLRRTQSSSIAGVLSDMMKEAAKCKA
jgi:hypothetical protein